MPVFRCVVVLLATLFVFVLAGCDTTGTEVTDPQPSTPGVEDPVFESGQYPMEVSNQSGAPIYQESQNDITVDIPFVSADSLLLRVGNNEVQGPTITVTPPGNTVTVDAYQLLPNGDERFLRQRTLPTIPPRMPRHILCINDLGQELASGESLDRSRPGITFTLDPDPAFATSHPSDARYQIGSARVWIRKGNAAPEELGTFNVGGNSRLSLRQQLRDAVPGDVLIVELEGLIRINANGNALPVSIPASSRRFAFILS